MNGKIIFDCCYCINSAETKEIMVHFILQPHHIFIRVKAFVGRTSGSYYQHVLAWHPVTSISKSHVLTARARVNCNINAWLSVLNSFQSYRTENIYKPRNETNNKQMIIIPQFIMSLIIHKLRSCNVCLLFFCMMEYCPMSHMFVPTHP